MSLQVILVDDGSPDMCPQICDEYVRKDARVQVVHQKNGGVSIARNAGLKAANGEYVCFIDGDDYVDQEYVDALIIANRSTNADIIVCGLDRIPHTNCLDVEKCKPGTVNRERALERLLLSEDITEISTCNKLYKRWLFTDNEITFPVGRVYSEDVLTAYSLYCASEKITYIADVLYHYIQRSSSATGTVNIRRILDSVEVADVVVALTKNAFPALQNAAIAFRLRFTLHVASEVCGKGKVDRGVLKTLSQWVRRNWAGIVLNTCTSSLSKVRASVLATGWLPYLVAGYALSLRTRCMRYGLGLIGVQK